MAQYDFYNYGKRYLLDVQSELLDGMSTRVVVPLLPVAEAPKLIARLNPVFSINGADYVLMPQFTAAISLQELRNASGNLSARHDDVRAALDMVFIGF